MKILIANSLPARIARGLNGFVSPEVQVVHLKDFMGPQAEDRDWMGRLAQEEGWLILTADDRVWNNPHQLQAWRAAGKTLFLLQPGWLEMEFWKQAEKLVKCLPRIIEHAAQASPGSVFRVSANGRIRSH